MTDHKPPRAAGDERVVLTSLLQYQRESLCRKVEGVPDEAARESAVGSGTSLLWLIRHMTHAEAVWIRHRFAGGDAPGTDEPHDSDTLAAAVRRYQSSWAEIDEVVSRHSLDDVAKMPDEPPVNLRWILAHLLEETARHAGHADILRELIDGETGR